MRKKTYNPIDRAHPFIYAVPILVIYLIFYIVPILINFGTSFTDWNVYTTEINFTGLENFIKFVKTGEMFNITKNTILFSIVVVFVQNVFGFFLALALRESTRINNFFRILFFAPAVMAILVWGYLFQTILAPNGLLNRIISGIIPGEITTAWLGSVDYAIFVAGAVNGWIWTGFIMTIYIAAHEYYTGRDNRGCKN